MVVRLWNALGLPHTSIHIIILSYFSPEAIAQFMNNDGALNWLSHVTEYNNEQLILNLWYGAELYIIHQIYLSLHRISHYIAVLCARCVLYAACCVDKLAHLKFNTRTISIIKLFSARWSGLLLEFIKFSIRTHLCHFARSFARVHNRNFYFHCFDGNFLAMCSAAWLRFDSCHLNIIIIIVIIMRI